LEAVVAHTTAPAAMSSDGTQQPHALQHRESLLLLLLSRMSNCRNGSNLSTMEAFPQGQQFKHHGNSTAVPV
jgi:hypothetical protein